MAHDLVDLCFRLILILWRKVCRWSEACNCWLVLSLPDMWSMKWAGYKIMLSKYLLLGLFLIMDLTLVFADFFKWVGWRWLIPLEDLWRKGSGTLNLRTVSMILDSMQVKREIPKVAPLEVGRGDLHAGRPEVPMMFDLYFKFFLQNKKKCYLGNLVLISIFSSLSLEMTLIMWKL